MVLYEPAYKTREVLDSMGTGVHNAVFGSDSSQGAVQYDPYVGMLVAATVGASFAIANRLITLSLKRYSRRR